MTKKLELYYFVAVSLALWIMLWYKAIVSPLIMDEATTYLEYARLWDVLPGQANWRTNNHHLNSILVALSTSIFGVHNWAIRLPNLLAFVVFAFYSYRWARSIDNLLGRLLLPLVLYGCLFYMEFFGLARGYGLSMAFLFAAANHQYIGLKEKSRRDQNWSFLFMSMAMIANLNLQFVYVAWWGLEFVVNFKSIKRNWGYLVLRLLPLMATITFSFVLRSKGSLDLGQDVSLLESISSILFVVSSSAGWGWYALVITLTVFMLVGFFLKSWKSKFREFVLLDVVIFLLAGNMIVVWLNHTLFGVLYPIHRSGQHWFLLWISAVLLSSKYLPRILKPIVYTGVVGVMFFQSDYWQRYYMTDRSADLIWRQEQVADEMANEIFKLNDPNVTLTGTFFYHRQWAYSALKNKAQYPLRMQYSIFKDTLSAFKLISQQMEFDTTVYHPVREENKSGLLLLKRKTPLKKELLAQVEIDSIPSFTQNKELLFNFGIPAKDKEIGMRLEFDLKADRSKFKSAIDVLINNSKGFKNWESVRLDKLYYDLKENHIVFNTIVPSNNEEELYFTVNFVNNDKVKCSIANARCYFYELK